MRVVCEREQKGKVWKLTEGNWLGRVQGLELSYMNCLVTHLLLTVFACVFVCGCVQKHKRHFAKLFPAMPRLTRDHLSHMPASFVRYVRTVARRSTVCNVLPANKTFALWNHKA